MNRGSWISFLLFYITRILFFDRKKMTKLDEEARHDKRVMKAIYYADHHRQARLEMEQVTIHNWVEDICSFDPRTRDVFLSASSLPPRTYIINNTRPYPYHTANPKSLLNTSNHNSSTHTTNTKPSHPGEHCTKRLCRLLVCSF